MELTGMSKDVWLKKYAKEGEVTYDDTCNRHVNAIREANEKIGNVESKTYYDDLYDFEVKGDFIYGGSILHGLGDASSNISLSNCYVLGINGDSLADIFDTAKRMAITYAYRGGVGVDISPLRPKGSITKNAAKMSTGSVSFMPLYSKVTEIIGQCVAKDQKVLTNRGLVNIQDVVSGDLVWTAKKYVKVLDTKYNGKKNVVKVNCELGMEIKTTKEHKYKCVVDGKLTELPLEEIDMASDKLCVIVPNDTIKLMCTPEVAESYYLRGLSFLYTHKNLIKDNKVSAIDPFVSFFEFSKVDTLHLSYVEDNIPLDVRSFYLLGILESLIYQYDNPSTGSELRFGTGFFTSSKYFNKNKIKDWYGELQQALLTCGILTKYHEDTLSDDIFNAYITLVDRSSYLRLIEIANLFVSTTSSLLSNFSCYMDIASDFLSEYMPEKSKMLQGNLYPVSFTIIDEDEITDTYDLVLESEHLFYCEGLYVHNSGRRGALMLSISDVHPDVFDFIKSKTELYVGQIEKANISVRVHDSTMKAYLEDSYVNLYFKSINEEVSKKVKAKDIIHAIAYNSWLYADPGILFWDHIIDNSPVSIFPETVPVSTNPCGEQVLSDGESCNLGHINFYNMVKNPFTDHAEFDFDKMKKVLNVLYRAMDTVIDINAYRHPLKIQQEKNLLARRIGIGFTGLGDTLAALGLKYGSEESLKTIDIIMNKFNEALYTANLELADERGVAPIFELHEDKIEEYINHPYFNTLPMNIKLNFLELGGFRNIAVSTVAPTGSTSILLGVTSGIEPLFSAYYFRTVIMGDDGNEKVYPVIHPILQRQITDEDNKKLNEYIINNDVDNMSKMLTFYKDKLNYIEAHELNWKTRIDIQSVVQKYIDNSISSTVNLPQETTVDDIEQLYVYAWNKKLKGVTVYRDGSRSAILTKDSTKVSDNNKVTLEVMETEEELELYKQMEAAQDSIIAKGVKLPSEFLMKGYKVKSEGKKWYFLISFMDRNMSKPFAIFIKTNSKESSNTLDAFFNKAKDYATKVGIDAELVKSQLDKYEKHSAHNKVGRLVGFLLRHNVPIGDVINLIGEPVVGSLLFWLKKILLKYYIPSNNGLPTCPECGGTLILQEGCYTCMNCGYSKCG